MTSGLSLLIGGFLMVKPVQSTENGLKFQGKNYSKQ